MPRAELQEKSSGRTGACSLYTARTFGARSFQEDLFQVVAASCRNYLKKILLKTASSPLAGCKGRENALALMRGMCHNLQKEDLRGRVQFPTGGKVHLWLDAPSPRVHDGRLTFSCG